jgi:hypothetical protein
MATITPSNTSGAAVTFAAASAGGDTVAFGSASRPIVLVNNTSGSTVTVTLTAVNACSQNFLHNQSATCPTGITEIVPNAAVIDGTAANRGNVLVTYSSATSVTVGAVSS